jgi:hypothetical protein
MRENLGTYLNDHLAGSVAAVSLIDDLLAGDIDASLKTVLARLKREIAEEQDVLRKILQAHSLEEGVAKKGAAWLMEKLSTLKLGGKDRNGNALPIVQALETLYLGITGKLLEWQMLEAVMGSEMASLEIDLPALKSRAEAQRSAVDEHRMAYAKIALAVTDD